MSTFNSHMRQNAFVRVMLANKLLLQELNKLIEIKLLYSVFSEILILRPNFQGRANAHFPPPSADAHGYQ